MKRIVAMGRGGVGKTSFVALMTKFFIEIGETPLFLIDADPDQNLADMVGVDLKQAGNETISEILYDFLEEGGSLTETPPQDRLEPVLWEKGLYEGASLDLIAVGTKWGEGCYCLPNSLLKNIIPTIARNYRYTIIDSPAGLEHLNRRIATKVEDIFDIVGPSKKSFDHVKRAYRVIEEVNIQFENFYLIGGYRFPKNLEKRAEEKGLKYLGKINYDENVEKFILEGRSLLDLPSDSPAYVSVKEIMQRAGYTSLKELLFPKR